MPSQRNVILSILTRVAVSALLLVLGIAIFWMLLTTRTPPSASDLQDIRPRVTVLPAQAVPVRRQFEGFGTAAARRAASVPAQVRGIVEHVPDEIVAGAVVKRGQVLMRLDDEDYQREVEIITQQMLDTDAQIRRLDVELQGALRRLELAQQEVELAEADLQRVLEAQETAGATQREVDQQRQILAARTREEIAVWEQLEQIEPRRAQLQAARSQQQASLRLAQRNLERTVITSPIDGVLQQVDVDPGESVQMDQQVARVVDLRRIEVPLRLPAAARRHLAVGNEATLTSASNDGQRWAANVTRIAPEDDETGRTVTVYVEREQDPSDPSGPPLLAPGQFVRASVQGQQQELRYVAPRRALAADRMRFIEDGVVTSRRVETDFQVRGSFPQLGLDDEHWLVLRNDLPEGTLIMVDGTRRIAEGTPVQPIAPNGTEMQLAVRPDSQAEPSP